MTTNSKSHKVGREGEKVAASYLERRSFDIIETNWRTRYGEIDIIGKEGDILVFVEVKSSSSPDSPFLHYQVDDRKQQQIYSTAQDYLSKNNPNPESMRFDVIFMTKTSKAQWKIEHIKDAFQM